MTSLLTTMALLLVVSERLRHYVVLDFVSSVSPAVHNGADIATYCCMYNTCKYVKCVTIKYMYLSLLILAAIY